MVDLNSFLAAIADGDAVSVAAHVQAFPGAVNLANFRGATSVVYAVEMRQRAIARLLIDLGQNVGAFEAAAVGDADLVSDFIRNDPAVAKHFCPAGWTLLHLAVLSGNPVLCSLLAPDLEILDAESSNLYRATPLQLSIIYSEVECATALLASGADPNLPGTDLLPPPLHLAASLGVGALVRELLAYGADVDLEHDDLASGGVVVRDGDSLTLPHVAREIEGAGALGSTVVVLKGGADDGRNRKVPRRAIDFAIIGGHGDVIGLLSKSTH